MKDTRTLIEISLLVALAYVLQLFAIWYSRFFWPQGGSVSISLVPMAIIAYRHGAKLGLMAGIVYGVLSMTLAAAPLIHWLRVLLDFFFPLMGAAFIIGLWSKKIAAKEGLSIGVDVWLSTAIASLWRFVSHYLSGLWFFYMFAPEGVGMHIYSLVYNLPQQLFNWLICAPILVVLLKRYNFGKVAYKGMPSTLR